MNGDNGSIEKPSLTIILIGPISAGKSTIGQLLAEMLGLKRYSLDEVRWDYYKEIGYDEALASRIRAERGMPGLLLYWKPFEAHAVERVLADFRDCVIDFGAGHSVYEDEAFFARVQRALAPFPNVILLLPTCNLDESVEILNARFAQMLMEEVGEIYSDLLSVNEHFVKHPSNHQLAKLVIYTQGKIPEETCAEILNQLVERSTLPSPTVQLGNHD